MQASIFCTLGCSEKRSKIYCFICESWMTKMKKKMKNPIISIMSTLSPSLPSTITLTSEDMIMKNILMDKSSFFLLHITITLLVFSSTSSDGKVMMEYIGATGKPVTFEAVPINDEIDFHFILSFAIDADQLGNPQNGSYSPYWASTLTPSSVAEIKARHPNVKALASLSGWSINNKTLRWYKPVDPQIWIMNAFTSLKAITETYHLDGIDVDYETFSKRDNSFAHCVGELITILKNQSVISVATISPFYSTVIPYMELFRGYKEVIDYVNYQFYTDNVKTPEGYLQAFKRRAGEFSPDKVMASYEVRGRGIQGDAFFDALKLLEGNGYNISGVMIFSADASASNGYYYEKKSQDFLVNSTSCLYY